MDFTLTDDRRLLDDTLRRFFADRYPMAVRQAAAAGPTGTDPAIWAGLAGLGIIGALFPEAAGGYAGAGADIALVFEAAGRVLCTEPLLATLMAGTVLARTGEAALLAEAIAGTTRIAFAHGEARARYAMDRVETRAEEAGGWRLTGVKAVVPNGGEADQLVITARSLSGLGLFLVAGDAPGLTRRSVPGVDGSRVAEISLAATPARLLENRALSSIDAALGAGLLALCAESLGAMEVARDITLGYLGTRQQFGVPIGSFQVLQHRMADLMIDIEQMRSLVINAAAGFGGPVVARDRALSAAKHAAGRTGQRLAEEVIQMHGGMGMTWDYPIGHYAKRLVMIDHLLGDARHHLERFVALGR